MICLFGTLILFLASAGGIKAQGRGVIDVALPANYEPDVLGLANLTAAEAITQLCSGRITAVQYATALLGEAQRWECINAWSALNVERVLTEAGQIDARAAAGEDTGPLCGLAVLVKDLYDVANYTTAAGTPTLEAHIPANNTLIIDRLLAQNGLVLGKTRMHELAYGVTSINPHFGPVLNPYDNTCHVGGSSGGTGALLAARVAPVGFCSDTGGSCRIPGALNGVAGFRPSWGCWQAGEGIVGLVPTRDTAGMMARTVEDITILHTLLSSCNTTIPSVSLEGLRVGYPTNWWTRVADEMNGTYEAAFDALREAGVEIVEVDFSPVQALSDQFMNDSSGYNFEMGPALSQYLTRQKLNLSFYEVASNIASPITYATVQSGNLDRPLDSYPTLQDYIDIFSIYRPQLQQLYNLTYDASDIDVIIVPTTAVPATPIDATEPYTYFKGEYLPNRTLLRVTAVIEPLVGAPSLSLPIGLTTMQLPVGLQLAARPGEDNLLLAVGDAMQAALPEMPPPPGPLCTGCSPRAVVQEVTYGGSGPLEAGQTTSAYTLEFDGSCEIKGMLSSS